jgi:hypothetical protein
MSSPGGAQTSARGQKPTFEVASIRLAMAEGSTRSQIETAPDGLVLRNISLGEMVEWAYGLQHSQVSGSANLENHRYDVRARAAGQAVEPELRVMMQDLLATRFKLKLHTEQKQTSVYQLVVAKGGPRLPPDKSGKLPASYPRERFPRVMDGLLPKTRWRLSWWTTRKSRRETKGADDQGSGNRDGRIGTEERGTNYGGLAWVLHGTKVLCSSRATYAIRHVGATVWD